MRDRLIHWHIHWKCNVNGLIELKKPGFSKYPDDSIVIHFVDRRIKTEWNKEAFLNQDGVTGMVKASTAAGRTPSVVVAPPFSWDRVDRQKANDHSCVCGCVCVCVCARQLEFPPLCAVCVTIFGCFVVWLSFETKRCPNEENADCVVLIVVHRWNVQGQPIQSDWNNNNNASSRTSFARHGRGNTVINVVQVNFLWITLVFFCLWVFVGKQL